MTIRRVKIWIGREFDYFLEAFSGIAPIQYITCAGHLALLYTCLKTASRGRRFLCEESSEGPWLDRDARISHPNWKHKIMHLKSGQKVSSMKDFGPFIFSSHQTTIPRRTTHLLVFWVHSLPSQQQRGSTEFVSVGSSSAKKSLWDQTHHTKAVY